MNELLKNFHNDVVLKFHLYNALFLTLPFSKTEETGNLLPIFNSFCRHGIDAKQSPLDIINNFFSEQLNISNESDKINVIFRILQFIERQIVLFDALEDAAFTDTHKMHGKGSLRYFLSRIEDQKQSQFFLQQISDYKIRIVLTAHPTQFYPSTILGILTELQKYLRQDKLTKISQILLQMGKTSFKYEKKPTPFEEAESLVWYVDQIFYEVIPRIQSEINAATSTWQNKTAILNSIEIGFWPGGDRDGNPFVVAQTTLEVARLLKSHILQHYMQDLDGLLKKLTFSGLLQPLQRIKDKMEQTYLHTQLTHHAEEHEFYTSTEIFLNDLHKIRQLLIEKHDGLFLEVLDYFITKVNCFGFYYCAMDLRENSKIYKQVFQFILENLNLNEAKNYHEFTDVQKIQFLKSLISEKHKFNSTTSDLQVTNALDSLRIIKSIQDSNGEKALCRHVISNTDSAFNILELLIMLNLIGEFEHAIPVDLIPLFESIDDLERADTIMKTLFDCDFYAEHLQQRENTQYVMLGFSDGTKDGGYVSANWSIYKAKMQMTALARKYNIKIIFFDGRGGPPARGGGNTNAFYRSLGSKIAHSQLQLTVQGQTISSNFGTSASAKYNIEQLFTAGLIDLVFKDETNNLSAEEIELMQCLSKISQTAYLNLKNDPLFIPYLEKMTPLKFFSELNIGSRPTSRQPSSHLEFTDLRAIPFVTSWSQLKQNIPGYYGFGYALQQLIDQGKLKQLQQFYQHSLFFRTLVENTMMSLTKSFFPLTEYMKTDPIFGEFWQKLFAEAELTEKLLLVISQQSVLLENDPINRESIKLREEIVFPLLVIQQYAMIRIKEECEGSELYESYKKIILKALAANTNASRNSA